jgi:hypothetical protein
MRRVSLIMKKVPPREGEWEELAVKTLERESRLPWIYRFSVFGFLTPALILVPAADGV